MLAKLKEDREIETNTSISPVLNDPTIKTYFTVIILICIISLCKKNILYNTKSVFINLSKFGSQTPCAQFNVG